VSEREREKEGEKEGATSIGKKNAAGERRQWGD
jgi:hypothetical protein